MFSYLRRSRAHPTAEAVFAALRGALPTLSRTTIYSTLHQLAAKHLALALHAEDDEVRYDGDVTPHAHFKCRSCGGFYDVPYPDGVKGGFADLPPGFVADDEQLVYYGVCRQCSGGKSPRGRGGQRAKTAISKPNQTARRKEHRK